ncbi:MAG: hypothetical protein ACJ74O_13485 [Frankiaceae bacterium]|jgi:hypothetical protein
MPIPGVVAPPQPGIRPAGPLAGMQVVIDSLTLNAIDPDGVAWSVADLDGWWGADTTGDSVPRPNAHGAWDAPRYFAAKAITMLGGAIVAPTPEALEAARATLSRSIPVDRLVTLTVAEPTPKRAQVKRIGRLAVRLETDRIATWSCVVEAPDPRRYATVAQTVRTTLPDPHGGGALVPWTVPLVLGERSPAGFLTVTNEGDIDAPWTAVGTGPIDAGWAIRLGERYVAFDFAVPPGRQAAIDALNGLVTVDGAEYEGRVARGSTWFFIPPGVSQLAVTGTGSGRVDLTAASAWS